MSLIWDQRYETPGAFGEEPNDFLRAQEQLIRTGGPRTLCIGEGEGRNAIWLAQCGQEVTAIDLSEVGLRHAAERAERLGVKLQTIQADLARWDFGDSKWDLIVSIFCHLPRELRGKVHQGVIRGLAPGGRFVLEAYSPRQLQRGTGGPSTPELLVAPEDLRTELATMTFEHLAELTREVIEGRLHTGMADVTQMVARK